MTPFVDFGKKTMYSLKNAMGTTKTILPVLKEREQKYFAVSDYGEVSGWVNQLFTCKDNSIIPILGMETFVNNYRFQMSEDKTIVHKMSLTDDIEKEDTQFKDDELDYAMIDFPLDLFARTIDGYYNVIQIHNEAQINGVDKRPRITEAYLKLHGKGVVALLPSPYSEIATLVYNGYENEAISKLKAYQQIFDDVYMEITILEDEDYREINGMLVQFCKKHQVKMIPVINSHYDLQEDGEVFPIFQKCGKLRGGFSYEADFAPNMYYKTAEEVFDTFKRFHESKDFTMLDMQMMFMNLENLCKTFTLLDIDTSPKLPKMENSAEKLKELAWQGMERLGYKGKPEYEARLNMELDNVIGVGFADYFLMLYGLFDWHINKKHRLPSVGRGSASSSLILNCLNITHIDPLKYELPFERFLSVDKLKEILKQGGKITGNDYPDVDSDFSSGTKDSVKDYFADTYGKNNICSIGTVGFLHTKSALKELARVYDVPPEEINILTTEGLKDFEADDDELPLDELKIKFPALALFLRKHPEFEKSFSKLQGTINCWGVHAGGILISDKPLIDQLPVRVNDGKLATVWTEGLSGRELGQMGFIKLDILAIETLDIIEETIDLINSRYGKGLKFEDIPWDEPNALARIEKGDNIGVFQFETPLALRVCEHMGGLHKFEDIASLSTLMRPAALENKFDVKFGNRKNGKEKYFIPHCMRQYMDKEYGLPIYQEAALYFALHLAKMDLPSGYTMMKLLYKGKMTNEKIPYWREKFIDGSKNNMLHEEIEITLDNGEVRRYRKDEMVKCKDGVERTIEEVLTTGVEIE